MPANPSTPYLTRRSLVDRFERISDWLYAGDYDIECRKVDAVVTRYPHVCCSIYHTDEAKGVREIPARTLVIVERAKVDGKFGSAYTCQECIVRAEKETSSHD